MEILFQTEAHVTPSIELDESGQLAVRISISHRGKYAAFHVPVVQMLDSYLSDIRNFRAEGIAELPKVQAELLKLLARIPAAMPEVDGA